MFASLLILGRQSALGLAELESLYGAASLHPLGPAVLLDQPASEVDFDRLGGSIKLAKVLTTLPTTKWAELIKYVASALPQHLGYLPEGKLKFGLSCWGLDASPAKINRSTLELKKVIKKAGRSVRVVPNKETSLNSAQVLSNHLTGSLGMELLLIRDEQQTILAQTVSEQDINAYAARDQARPKRDSHVGMLPPKLAQIIVNLAGTDGPKNATLLDPFCGTGVILQEAALAGYNVCGTDLEARMIEYSQANFDWLQARVSRPLEARLEVADARKATWAQPFDFVASETYLGTPLTHSLPPSELKAVIDPVDKLHREFLQNLASQTKTGFRACLAVPAWKTDRGFKHLSALDSLEELGYTRLSFAHASNEELIYHREGQFVARELVVLIRK